MRALSTHLCLLLEGAHDGYRFTRKDTKLSGLWVKDDKTKTVQWLWLGGRELA